MARVERRHREAALALFGFASADDAWLARGEGGHYGNRFAAAAQALAEWEERGAAREREAVVAEINRQLREMADDENEHNMDGAYSDERCVLERLRGKVERMEHLKPCAESQD